MPLLVVLRDMLEYYQKYICKKAGKVLVRVLTSIPSIVIIVLRKEDRYSLVVYILDGIGVLIELDPVSNQQVVSYKITLAEKYMFIVTDCVST